MRLLMLMVLAPFVAILCVLPTLALVMPCTARRRRIAGASATALAFALSAPADVLLTRGLMGDLGATVLNALSPRFFLVVCGVEFLFLTPACFASLPAITTAHAPCPAAWLRSIILALVRILSVTAV